jgi:integrase
MRERGEGGLFRNEKKSQNWYAQYYQDGRQIRVSTGTAIKAEAIQKLRKLMGDRDDGLVPVSDMKKLRYADLREMLIESYVGQKRKSLKAKADGSEYIAGLTALDEACGFKQEDGKVVDKGLRMTALTSDFARRFARERREKGTGNAAINRSLAALRHMLKLAKEDGKISNVPSIKLQKEPDARTGFVEPEKFAELLNLLPSHLRPLIQFLYDTGVRVGEALQIEWGQVDFDARIIALTSAQTKNSEARILTIFSHLASLLADARREGKVFDGTNLRKEWMTACAACGLGTKIEVKGKPYDPRYEGLRLHDLRRSAIRNLIRSGVSETVSMKISGHKTNSVFKRYNITSTEDITKAMQAVEIYRMNRLNGKTIPALREGQ